MKEHIEEVRKAIEGRKEEARKYERNNWQRLKEGGNIKLKSTQK